MRERGIIFNTEMVRAIIDGRKTQTRRIAKFKPFDKGLNLNYSGLKAGNYQSNINDGCCVLRSIENGSWNDRTHPLRCPYGQIGDRLWVRETWQGPLVDYDEADKLFKDPDLYQKVENCVYRADGIATPEYTDCDDNLRQGWRPSIQMPRWASRITLEITNVRVERLQDISEQDVVAEGIIAGRYGNDGNWLDGFYLPDSNQPYQTAKGAFCALWQSIYGVDSFYKNPWVWVIEFKKVE